MSDHKRKKNQIPRYAWSRRRQRFHVYWCEWAQKIKPKNYEDGTHPERRPGGDPRTPCKVCLYAGG